MIIGNNSNSANTDYSSRGVYAGSLRMNGAYNNNSSGIGMASGQVVSGEVISKDGNQITLKISGDQTISAKLDSNADIDVGQILSFEVGKSGNNQTILRPLYANLATNTAVNAAISQAGLPLNSKTIEFTTQMMQEGMSINRNALQSMARNVFAYPGASPADIVSMVKIGIPLSQTNVTQFENYTNFEHQINSDSSKIADGLTQILQNAFDGSVSADSSSPISVANDIFNLIDFDSLDTIAVSSGEEILNASEADVIIANETQIVDNSDATTSDTIEGQSNNVPVNPNISLDAAGQAAFINELNDIISLAGSENKIEAPIDAREVLETVRDLINNNYVEDEESTRNNENTKAPDLTQNIEQEDALESSSLVSKNAIHNTQAVQKQVLDVVNNTKMEDVDVKAQNYVMEDEQQNSKQSINDKLNSLIKSNDFGKILKDAIKAQFQLKPSDIASEGKVEELYDRILKQTAKINDFLQNNGYQGSEAAKAAANLGDNVNFMNQLNEFVNYVQLPLKMAGEDAHGELYVYTKKKNLQNNDGNFSALLHLDMEHLGPMDVHVAMKNYTNVNTHFYLKSDELLDFINSHIDELSARLTKLGYNTTCQVTQKDTVSKEHPITDEFTKEDNDTMAQAVSKLCFDVRA